MDAPTLHASRKTKKTQFGEIPVDWGVSKLDHVAIVQTGLAKGKKGIKNPAVLPYLRVANVQDGYFDLAEIKTITVERSEINRYSLRKNDVLLTEGGDLDKLGRGHLWEGQIEPCLHQNHVFVVRTKPNVLLPRFFALLTAGPYGRRYFLSCAKQTTNLASINSTQLKQFPVLIPPLREQQQIAAVLGTWDRASTVLENLLAAKRQRKQALMQQLLTGQKRFPKFKGKEWRTVHLGDVFTERTEINRTDLPLVAITSDRGVIPRNELDRNDTSSEDKSRYLRIAPGDIGYNTMRMWQGVSGVSEVEGIVSPAYTVCVPRDGIDRYYAGYLFKSRPVIYLFHSHSQGLVKDTLNLKFPNFARIKVSLPPIEEQRRIASVFRALDQEISLLVGEGAALRNQKKGLMQQLLTGKVRVKGVAHG
jgi:type I restriction enzyme S subunit